MSSQHTITLTYSGGGSGGVVGRTIVRTGESEVRYSYDVPGLGVKGFVPEWCYNYLQPQSYCLLATGGNVTILFDPFDGIGEMTIGLTDGVQVIEPYGVLPPTHDGEFDHPHYFLYAINSDNTQSVNVEARFLWKQ